MKYTMKTTLAAAGFSVGLLMASQAATILIDYDDGDAGNGIHDTAVLNGDFTTNASWVATGTEILFYTTNKPSGVGSARNNAIAGFDDGRTRYAGVDSGWTITVGTNAFETSYMWASPGQMLPADTVSAVFFYTDDDTIGGARTVVEDLVSAAPITVTDPLTWVTVSTNFSFDGTGLEGKPMFVELRSNLAVDPPAVNTHSRFDNIYLSQIPEPSSVALLGLGGLALGLRRRRK